MSAPQPLLRVPPATLVQALDEPGVAVVDVRGPDEFAEGHIRGAVSLPTPNFSGPALDALVQGPLADKSQVIFHCAKSQQRGPACAAVLQARLAELNIDKRVLVMDGGMIRFTDEFAAHQPQLIERAPGTARPGDS